MTLLNEPAAPTTETMLAELRSLSDQMDDLAAQQKVLSDRWNVIEHSLLDFHKATGLNSISGAGVSVSFDPTAMRAKYDPEKFASVFKWAAENGYEYILQRRFTDAKVMELVDAGIALPDGLTTESYTKIGVRRNKK